MLFKHVCHVFEFGSQWVNVSSGTGSNPGYPERNPQSRKMVVCVCGWIKKHNKTFIQYK